MGNRLICFLLISLLNGVTLFGQQFSLTNNVELDNSIISSGFIHRPLKTTTNYSYDSLVVFKKEVVLSEKINFFGELKSLNDTGIRPRGSNDDPDYATYGKSSICCKLGDDFKFKGYNRVAFSVFPKSFGMGVTNININIGDISSLVNLKPNIWNKCYIEIDNEILESADEISFTATSKGLDLTAGNNCDYIITDIYLEKVSNPYKSYGWIPNKDIISYATSGYNIEGDKIAIIAPDIDEKSFLLLDSENKVVFKNKIEYVNTTIGKYGILDFSKFKVEGKYYIKVGDLSSRLFDINHNIWSSSIWKILNFIYCQRCGCNIPGIHNTCHTDLFALHNGVMIPFCGGWHDAGDLSQQTLQTADVVYSLLELYSVTKEPILASRLREEAEWGLEFVLKNRFGDGYRASSMGLLHWLDGKLNTKDDITSVRVQNLSFDNFLYSAYESYAALILNDDKKLSEYLKKVAIEDFDFAMDQFSKEGFCKFLQPYEHTYNTSHSLYMATISWSASMLYKITKNKRYKNIALESIKYVIDCQQKEPIGNLGIKGFFWRDKNKKSVVHYIHQSREQIMILALVDLCRTFPNDSNYRKWQTAINEYGKYIKQLMRFTAPYGMIPSGIYHRNEYEDKDNFLALHLFPPADARDQFISQVSKGEKLSNEFYIKRFPVWFNIFNGNNAIILSSGKAAALCANFLNDKELKQIALEQLYWIVGKNPFGQSMIYGEGVNYPRLDNFSSGEIIGAIPVGIRSYNNEDIPYWPETTNACYKEVWVTSAGKWLSLLSEL